MRRIVFLLTLSMAMAMPGVTALANPLDEKAARKMLFAPRGVVTEVVDGALTKPQAAMMKVFLKGMKNEGLANYYGAVALSPRFFEIVREQPGTAALSGLFQVTERLHSPVAAARVALAACNEAARKAGAPACVTVAQILPKRYKIRPLTMSVNATAAFKAYRKAEGPKAFAISPTSRAYGLADGDVAASEAVAFCNEKIDKDSPKDCVVVVQDAK